MIDYNRQPKTTSGPHSMEGIVRDVMDVLITAEPVDDGSGRHISAHKSNTTQLLQVIGEEIDTAILNGEPTDRLEAERRAANARLYNIQEGRLPG